MDRADGEERDAESQAGVAADRPITGSAGGGVSIWLLIAAGLVVWTVLSAALGLWLGKLLRQRRRGGTIDLSGSVHSGTNFRNVRLSTGPESTGGGQAA